MKIVHERRKYPDTPHNQTAGLVGKRVEFTIAEAVEASVQSPDRDDRIDELNAKVASQAEAFGKLVEYVINGDHSDKAKTELLSAILSYEFVMIEGGAS